MQVCSLEGDFRAALSALAAAEPDNVGALVAALGHPQSAVAHAGELVVVTTNVTPGVVEALLQAASRRIVSIIWVDAPSYAGRQTRAEPGLLRLAAAGVPVAAVRHGDDLAAALDQPRLDATARA